MTKRRPTIKGRGAEILFGEPPLPAVEPLAASIELAVAERVAAELLGDQPGATSALPPEFDLPEPEPMPATEDLPDLEPIPADSLIDLHAEAAELPPVELPPEEAGMESALFEEAHAGGPGSEAGEEVDLLDLDWSPPPTPEMETAFIVEAAASEEPPEPVAETPIPTLEATMEERELGTAATIHQPPPPETTGDIAGSVVPPRPARLVFDLGPSETVATADVQVTGSQVERLELERELTEEEQKQLLALLGGARLSKMERELDRTYNRVLEIVGDNSDVSTECYNLLLKARDIIWRREASRIAQAEYYVEQVQARLKRSEDSRRGEKLYAWKITAWGGVWGLIFLAFLILLGQDWFRTAIAPTPSSDSLIDMRIFVPAMIWGGLGGVTAVWYSLFKHVGQRDFDTAFNLSYVGKPFMGIILGAAVYMVFHLLLRTLGVVPAGLETGNLDMPTVAPWLVYLMAWASGFKENRVFDLVDKVMKQIFSGSEPTPPAPPPEESAPTA